MVKCLHLGESIAITPDGPKGPKEQVKEGIIKLAQITSTPIIPLVWTTKNLKQLTHGTILFYHIHFQEEYIALENQLTSKKILV